jgi:hypothetical protein
MSFAWEPRDGTCSMCGKVDAAVDLHVRVGWVCYECGDKIAACAALTNPTAFRYGDTVRVLRDGISRGLVGTVVRVWDDMQIDIQVHGGGVRTIYAGNLVLTSTEEGDR